MQKTSFVIQPRIYVPNLLFFFYFFFAIIYTQHFVKYFSAKTKIIKQIFLIFLMLYIEERNVYTLKVFYKDSINV